MRPSDIVESALAAAQAEQLAVIVRHSRQLNLRWANNQLTTNGDTTATTIDVVAIDPAGGTATSSGHVSSPEQVQSLVAAARSAAAAAQPAPNVLPLWAGAAASDFDVPPADTSAEVLAPLAQGLGRVFRAPGDMALFGYAEVDLTTTYLGTSAGTRRRHVQPTGRTECTARAAGGSAWTGSADPTLAVDVDAMTAGLAADLRHQRRSITVTPGRRRVILSPSATADLMIDLYWSADARSAGEGRSVFAGPDGRTRIGERLGTGVTLASDPSDPTMPTADFECVVADSDSASVADNGLPLGPTRWIDDGILTRLIAPRSTAALLDVPVAPGIDNLALSVADGQGSVADVVARTEDALLVTCLWYNRVVDPQTLLLTGLTRDGVYVVRDGRIVGSCGNFRFNESPVSLLGRIVDAGGEERTLAREMGDYFNRATMPALTVEDFNLSTASEAH